MARHRTRPFILPPVVLALAAFVSCHKAPDAPTVPAGPQYCFKDVNYTFSTVATDPNGDSVAVRFDWGDSTGIDSSGWFRSGDTIAMTHAWQDTGAYVVRAWAKNRKQVTSGVSGSVEVRVVIHRPPATPAEPSGPDAGVQDSSYAFTAVDSQPDGLPIAFRFSWGDGDTSDWSVFVASGASSQTSYNWSSSDTFSVTVQAKDSGGALSQWSAPHRIFVRPDTVRWRYQTGHEIKSSPAIGPDGTVYVGSYDSCLYAVSPKCILKWRYRTGGQVDLSPAVAADGAVYLGSDNGYLYAFNPAGTLKWSHKVGTRADNSPAVGSDGTVYIGSDDTLRAFSAEGALQWQFPTSWPIASSPAIATNGTLYFISYDTVYAVNADGSARWRHRVSRFPGPPAIATDGTIYAGSRDTGTLYAINPDGTARWGCPLSGNVNNEPAIGADGTVYVGSSGGLLYAVNPDGTLKWSYATGGSVSTTPAIAADGTLFFGSDDGYVYALNSDGSLKWKYLTGGAVKSSPAIAAGGVMYVGSSDFYLYALWSPSPLASSAWPKFHHDLKNTGRVGGGK